METENIKQYKAYCEESKGGWGEYIVIYDEEDNEIARSDKHHPEGIKTFIWEGHKFIAMAYSGNPRTECYVRVCNKVFLKKESCFIEELLNKLGLYEIDWMPWDKVIKSKSDDYTILVKKDNGEWEWYNEDYFNNLDVDLEYKNELKRILRPTNGPSEK